MSHTRVTKKRQKFLNYLNDHEVMNTLTAALMTLTTLPEPPTNVNAFMVYYLTVLKEQTGEQDEMNGDNKDKEIERLKMQIWELERKVMGRELWNRNGLEDADLGVGMKSDGSGIETVSDESEWSS
uniref:Uncharacterized protein n=1 Tax=Cacopsylla melanoneura TaxID=428564 RepID=A0A8D8X976_9HEMI